MSAPIPCHTLINPVQLANWVAERSDIWQMPFREAKDLAEFVKKRNLPFERNDIERIWQLGLLRADLIVTKRKLGQPGFSLIKEGDDGTYYYADERPCQIPKNWRSGLKGLGPRTRGLDIWFHPFRSYVLHHIRRVLDFHFSPVYSLLNATWYQEQTESHLAHLDERFQSEQFVEVLSRLNNITAMVVAVEPYIFPNLFHMLRSSGSIDFDTQRQHISEHWREVVPCYQSIGIDRIESIRSQLCMDADTLEPNDDIHRILRLANGEMRLNVNGDLGLALLFRTMAEILRRAAEDIWSTKLPEEDEIGFHPSSAEGKARFYGSPRLFDGNRNVAQEFMRSFGLDYGLRVRWYVEGHTEYGALKWLISNRNIKGMEIINVEGNVIQRGGKGLKFIDSLLEDINQCIFSFISIDGDVSSNIKAVQLAAERDEMFGRVSYSTPDFELHNFSPSELEEILWDFAFQQGAFPSERVRLTGAIENWRKEIENLADVGKNSQGRERRERKSAREKKEKFGVLLAAAKAALPQLANVDKGQRWGARLMKYAWEHQSRSDGTLRPIIEAVQSSRRARRVGYQAMRRRYRTDEHTGEMVLRPAD